MDTKQWYTSTTVWGGIVALMAGVFDMAGYHILPADQASLVTDLASTIAGAAGIVAIIGRVKAVTTIGSTPPAAPAAATPGAPSA